MLVDRANSNNSFCLFWGLSWWRDGYFLECPIKLFNNLSSIGMYRKVCKRSAMTIEKLSIQIN